MGQQQLLLIILGVIIVGVAIAVGISMFSGQSEKSAKDAVMTDLNNLSADAYQYKIRPTTMGGGNGAYTGGGGYNAGVGTITTGAWGSSNPNATYEVTAEAAQSITLKGTSKSYPTKSVTATVDGSGAVTISTASW